MKILFLSRWFPFPPDNGARIRIFNLLKILAGRHEVDLVSFAGRNPTAVDPGRLRELCRKVTLVPYTDFDPDSMSSVSGFLSRTPRSVIATFSKSMQESVNEAWRTRSHDLVIASALDMAPYARHLEGGLKVLEEVELTSLWDQIAKERISREVKSRNIVILGNAADEITRIAESENADIIVIATHGWTGWRRFIFGSVAEKVVRTSCCPVLTICESKNNEKE